MDANAQGNQSADDGGNSQEWLKELRRKAEERDTLLPALQRENAVLKAGIDMSNPVTELFMGKSDLDWADPEAVKSAAEKYGLVKTAPANDQQQQVDPQQQVVQSQQQVVTPDPNEDAAAALRRIADAAMGADVPPLKDEAWKQAATIEEAAELYRQAGGIVNT